MGDTIVIETPVATVLEVSGLQGPQGPTGPQGPSGEASGSIAWSNVTGKPSTFTPSAHTHTSADVTDFASAVVAAAPPTTNASLLTSGTLADARLSAAVTTSLGKADTASQPGHTHAVSDVTGLQTALDGKQASGSYAAASHTHTPSEVGLGNVSNTAQVTSVSGTAPIVSSGGTTPAISIQNSPTLTGDVTINGASTGVTGSLKVGNTTGSFNRDVEIGGNGIVLRNVGGSGTTTIALGQGSTSSYTLTPPAASGTIALTGHTHAASDITSGTIDTARLASGTANSGTFLRGDQTWAAVPSGGISAVGASTADVLSVSGSDLVADDGGTIDSSDPFIKWDDAAGKLVYANPLSRPSGAMYVGLAPSTTALGSNAINVQATRTNAADVASGSASICIGTGSIRASGNESIAMGVGSFANASRAVGIGYAPSATGTSSVCVTGLVDVASGVNSAGINGTATLRAQFAARPFSAIYWSGQTTNNTATILNLDGTATNRFTIAASAALAVDILLVARRATTQDKWLVARRFLGIRRDGSNNTALIGTVQTLGTDQSAGSPTWTFALTADDTNEALQLEVTGATGETVEWRATAFYRVA